MSKVDIFSVCFTLWKLIGEDVYNTPKKVYVFRIINCIAMVTVIIFILSNLAKAEDEDYVKTLENFTTIFHTLFKYLLMIYHKKHFRELLDERAKRFWSDRRGNKNLSVKIDNIYKRTNVSQLAVVAGVLLILEIYFLIPYFTPNSVYLFLSNDFVDSIIMDAFILICQYYVALMVLPVVMGYDNMYLSLCMEMTVQIKLLKYKWKEVFAGNNADVAEAIANCVKHHTLLLSIHARMQKIYSITLLFHYLISIVTICFDMYQTFVRQDDLSNEILKIVSLTVIVVQFGFYCIPAEIVSSEFTDIGQAIYMSKWYNHEGNLQKLIIPIIIRCQRSHYFSAAGLLDININAFGSVVRTAFSFYALIRQVLSK